MPLLCCLDVDYRPTACAAAAVLFADWRDEVAQREVTHVHPAPPADYQAGQFFRRELPHLERLLALLAEPPSLIVVDGFVWLDADRPGLGAHLHRALGERIPVIGVAKRPYRQATSALPVLRGHSAVPLWVSSVGVDAAAAAAAIASMHGDHRVPTLLRRVDRLARDAQPPNAPGVE